MEKEERNEIIQLKKINKIQYIRNWPSPTVQYTLGYDLFAKNYLDSALSLKNIDQFEKIKS